MLIVNIPENLSDKINEFAKQACQTPEEYVVEMIEEMIAHKSFYDEAPNRRSMIPTRRSGFQNHVQRPDRSLLYSL